MAPQENSSETLLNKSTVTESTNQSKSEIFTYNGNTSEIHETISMQNMGEENNV